MDEDKILSIILLNLLIVAIITISLFAKFRETSLIARANSRWFNKPKWWTNKAIQSGYDLDQLFIEQLRKYPGYHVSYQYAETINSHELVRTTLSSYDNVVVLYYYKPIGGIGWSMEFNFNDLRYDLRKDEWELVSVMSLIHYYVCSGVEMI